MILDVNTYNFKDHDKIYSSYCNIYSSCLWNFLLLDKLEFKWKKNDSYWHNNSSYHRHFYHNIPNFRLMKLRGTKFQVKVWVYLKNIPRGTVETYSQVAKNIGKPLAIRAVASAIGKNPYAPKIPCHRVIRSDGSLGGYSGKGGLKTKRFLLKKEGIKL